MFSLQICRRSLVSAPRRPFLPAATYATAPTTPNSTPNLAYDDGFDTNEDLVDNLHNDTSPPTAGKEGFSRTPQPASRDETLRHEIPRYRLHCHSTRNNTITTFTQPDGKPIAWFSGGSCGFKRGQRASYEAGYQCSVQIFKKVEEVSAKQGISLELFFKGFGQGREAMQKALMTSEGESVRPLVASVTDRTPIKIGGTRAKKMRRL